MENDMHYHLLIQHQRKGTLIEGPIENKWYAINCAREECSWPDTVGVQVLDDRDRVVHTETGIAHS